MKLFQHKKFSVRQPFSVLKMLLIAGLFIYPSTALPQKVKAQLKVAVVLPLSGTIIRLARHRLSGSILRKWCFTARFA